MTKSDIIKKAMLNAVGVALYIIAVASFLFYVPKIFGPEQKPDTVLAPITMLSLLVLSASLIGLLIFGRPILWYWDGQKREAISLLAYTLGIFLTITIIALVALLLSL